jgi:hypothetical protein
MYIGVGDDADWWTVSGFRIVAKEAVRSLQVNQGIRLVNNLMECPQGDGSRGCLTEAQAIGNPSVLSNWKLFGNITQNAGCGDGATGDVNDGATAAAQSWQLPCATNTTPATLTSQAVGADYVCVSATGTMPSFIIGDVVIMDSDEDGSPEEVFVEGLTCNANASWRRLRRSQLAATTFSARPFSWRPHINNKLYHVWYCGTDCSGMEQGWNIFRNNSAILTSNFHSTPCSGGTRSIVSVTAGPPGTPARLVIAAAFTPISSGGGGTPVNGDRIDLTDGHSAGERPVYVSVVSATEFDLYTDPGLTTPYETAGTGGWASRCGFHQHSLLIHDNLYYKNNGACIDFSTADPDMGEIRVWNNIFWECGTGPDVGATTAGAQQASGISIHALTREGNNRYGTDAIRKIEIFNNTFYKSGIQSDTAFRGAIVHQQPLWDVVVRNNIFHQPDGLPFFYMGAGSTRVNSDGNIWFGSNSGSIPGDAIRHAGDTNSPLLADPAGGDFRLQPSSLARDAGVTLAAVARDYRGVVRPQGAAYDIGAFEMVAEGAPGRPSGLAATAVSESAIDLAWLDNSSDETSFRVERATGSTGTFSEIGTAGAGVTVFQDTALGPATEYCYRVRAEGPGGISEYSVVKCASTGPAPDPLTSEVASAGGTAVLIRVRRPSPAACTLQWGGSPEPLAAGPRAVMVLKTGLTPGTIFNYSVECGGESVSRVAETAAAMTPGMRNPTFRFAPPAGLGATRVKVRYGSTAGNLDQVLEAPCPAACSVTGTVAADSVIYVKHEYWNESSLLASSEISPMLVR